MENIHTRLRHEIERIYGSERGVLARAARDMGMPSVQELSDVVGERKRITANLLAQMAVIGVDVAYVVTGERVPAAQPVWSLPPGAAQSNGQVLLSLKHWATLLNLRAEHGQGRDLMWCAALLQALDGYTPADPMQLAAQQYMATVKHGRSRQGVALYLVGNMPSAPWLVWPEGNGLQEVYALDMGEDSLPLFVPDTRMVPAPALLLSEVDLSHLNMGQTLLVDWHGAGGALRDGDRPADYADKTARAIKRCFAPR